jgi:hypothetical protein
MVAISTLLALQLYFWCVNSGDSHQSACISLNGLLREKKLQITLTSESGHCRNRNYKFLSEFHELVAYQHDKRPIINEKYVSTLKRDFPKRNLSSFYMTVPLSGFTQPGRRSKLHSPATSGRYLASATFLARTSHPQASSSFKPIHPK